MIEKLVMLHPEIALFIATCATLVLGLSPAAAARRACPWVAGLGLVVAAWLGVRSPQSDGLFPNLFPYVKTLIALIGLLVLPLLAGVVDRPAEGNEKASRFDPMRATRGEFYSFFLFSLTGVMLCATADDLIWLFLALELTSLPTYVMVALSTPRDRSQEAGVKYFFLGAMSAAMFLYGFALLYGAAGTTLLPEIRDAFAAEDGLSMLAIVGLVLAILGVSFKIAATPMHFYAPDVYQGAASPVAAFLAFAPKAAGFLALLQLLALVGWHHGPQAATLPEALRVALWLIAALTMVVGNVLALLQSNVKRLLAYSSIAHSGYMLVGLIAGPGKGGALAANGLAATLFYLLCYGVMNLGAFAVLACLEKRNEQGELEEAETFEDIRGLVARRPGLAWAMTLCSLSLLGLPPLLGFWGKLWLFTAAISAGEIPLAIVLGVTSAIAAFYYLRLVSATMLERREPSADWPVPAPAPTRWWSAMLSAAGVVVVVIWTSPLQQASDRAASLEAEPSRAAADANASNGLNTEENGGDV